MKRLKLIDGNTNSEIYIDSGVIKCDNIEIATTDIVSEEELTQKLESINWNKFDTIFCEIHNKKPIFKIKFEGVGLEDDLTFSLMGNSFSDSDKALVKRTYDELFKSQVKSKNLADLSGYSSTFNNLGRTIETHLVTFDNIVTIDLLNDRDYTNTVNLSRFLDSKCYLDVYIKYSINNDIYSCNTSFCIERGENIIEDIVENMISLEFINGSLRAIPMSQDIDECIINNCLLTYGRI